MQPSTSIPVFVISLAGAEERRAHITKTLSNLSLPFTIIDGVDGRQFDMTTHPAYNRSERLKYFGRDLTGGELGCTLSHKKIFNHMVDHKIDRALILEDDVIFYEGFKDTLIDILACPLDYDMVRFFGSPKILKAKSRKICDLPHGATLNRLCATPGGTYCYIITLAGAKKLLAHMEKNTYPIDGLAGRSWQTGLNWLAVLPLMAYVDFGIDSMIGEKRFDKSLQITGLQKNFYPLTRSWFKLSEMLGKKYWFYKNYWKDKTNGQHR